MRGYHTPLSKTLGQRFSLGLKPQSYSEPLKEVLDGPWVRGAAVEGFLEGLLPLAGPIL
jgi:hypothetical protein